MNQRQLQKTIESFDNKKFDVSEDLLTHVLAQIVKHHGIDIQGGRVWKLDPDTARYRLATQAGKVQRIRKDFVINVREYRPFRLLAAERTIVAKETNRYFLTRGIKKYSATGVGEIVRAGRFDLYEYVMTFNTSLTKEQSAPTLNIISITASRMLRNKRSERKSAQFERELDKAREIQQSILPEESLRFHHYEIFGTLVADKIVGGDFFDYIVSPENDRVDIAIGDAASKGISAAVQALYVSGALRMGAAYQTKISTLVRNINTLVHHAFKDERFLTLFVAELTDDSQGLCVYVNAGHNSPLLSRAKTGAVERLAATGTIIGPFPDQLFRRESVMLNKGDVLLLYTDGVSEAMDASRKQYSEKRLARKLRELTNRSAKQIAQLILADVQKFNAKSKYVDDKMVVVIKRVM